MINRSGRLLAIRPETVLLAGDEVLLLAGDGAEPNHLRAIFAPATRRDDRDG
jgi:hypothetical protein